MNQYEIIIFIVCLTSLLAYLNSKFFKQTATIGIMSLSLIFSFVLIVGYKFVPHISRSLEHVIASIDFHSFLLDGMLAFLLFAGAIHIDANSLRKERLPIIMLATLGIFISTFVVGTLLYYLFPLFGIQMEYIYCLLFAALISPTDPIAVLAILKKAGLPKSLELKIAGESLFNDGVAVVVFLTILKVADTGVDNLSAGGVSMLFLQQALGGLVYGGVLGYVSHLALQSIDQYEVEVMITLSTVMGGYLLAEHLGVSGPLAMVVAGLVVGNKSRESGISDITRDYLEKFWELIDELLNAMLFMLIGFEMLVINFDTNILIIGAITIALVLSARWLSVALPVSMLRKWVKFEPHAIAILTWGGLRGGLSVALALSLPASMHRDQFVSITYIVVVFSIIVQGLTIGKLYKRLQKPR